MMPTQMELPLLLVLAVTVASAWTCNAVADTTAGATTDGVYDIADFQAVGDGKTLNTGAIQNAIDKAHDSGGGIVHLGPGRWLTGTLMLKSNVTLHLSSGATLLGSTDLADYPIMWPKFKSFTDEYVCQALLYAENQQNIAVTGSGTIDGQGGHETFQQEGEAKRGRPYGYRPYLIRFVTSRAVRIEGITLRDSPMWVQQYLACDDVTLKDLTVNSLVNRNNDMIDIDCCRNVRISGCTGNTGDDAITLKSTADRITENVAITNCVVSSRCNAFKCGTESNGGFRNITISNIVVRPSRQPEAEDHPGLAGIALEVVDGGIMDGVVCSNFVMEGTTSPVFLRLGNRARPFTEGAPKPGVGIMRNIIISNIICRGATRIGCPIAGIPGHRIENVTLSDIKLRFAGGGTRQMADRAVPEREEHYPESQMFGTLPAYGFYVRHVQGLTLNDVDVRFDKPDRRAAVVCEDVADLHVNELSAQAADDGAPTVILKDTVGAMIRGCTAKAHTGTFLQVIGRSSRINLVGNDLSRAASAFELGSGVDTGVLFENANR